MQLSNNENHNWVWITLVLCAFGLLREIRPSEPFVTEFLVGEWRNVTQDQVYQEVYPIGTYSYLAQLVLVFLLTDYLRFKPVIILSGICGIVVYVILLWTTSLTWLQVSQFVYGLYMATEVAYYTYIFAKVDGSKYARVSSYTRMAALTGRFVSGLSADLLTRFQLMNYRELNYITFSAQILATVWALWLPPVKHSVYFHRIVENESAQAKEIMDTEQQKKSGVAQTVEAFSLIARHVRAAYSRARVVRWSALYALSVCLFVQTQSYVQLLWMDIQGDDTNVAYNGLVEAALTLLGAGGAWLSSAVSAGLTPAPLALLQAAAVFAATHCADIYVAYAGYIVVGVSYHYVITLTSTKIACELSDETCFGVVFGVNTLAGTALQAALTLVAISWRGLAVRAQYYALAGLYLALAAGWGVAWAAGRRRVSADVTK